MTESTSSGPSKQVNLSAFVPPQDQLELAEQEAILREHAHLAFVYYSALLAEGVDFHLAETLIEEWSHDTLEPISRDDDRQEA